MSRWVFLSLHLILLCIKAGSFHRRGFYLPASATKCVYEKLHTNIIVSVEYTVSSYDHHSDPTISLKIQWDEKYELPSWVAYFVCIYMDNNYESSWAKKCYREVTSPYGNTLHREENMTRGQFAFTTTEAGNYLACFWIDGHNPGGGDSFVFYTWKTGIAPKD